MMVHWPLLWHGWARFVIALIRKV